jgi:hypothetical protein
VVVGSLHPPSSAIPASSCTVRLMVASCGVCQ